MQDIKSTIATLRPGDALQVDLLSDLASTLPELQQILEAVHRRGAWIEEMKTGRKTSDPTQAASMAIDAAAEMRKGPPAHVSRANGRKSQGRPRKVREMSAADAKAIWLNHRDYPTDADALAAMPGWTHSAAYRTFKRSGRPRTGRPAKQ